MKILVINGPNLNFLGIRNTAVYGKEDYNALVEQIQLFCESKGVEVELFQSNHEGAIIDRLQEAYHNGVDGVVINPGAFTHYSYGIRDAISSVHIKTVEVHISNIHEREAFRQISVTNPVCVHQIAGHGLAGYTEAIEFLIKTKDIGLESLLAEKVAHE